MTITQIIGSVLAILASVIAALMVKAKTKAEAGDLISQSAVRLVDAMEARFVAQEERVSHLEATVEALREDAARMKADSARMKVDASRMKVDLESRANRIVELERRGSELERWVSWLHDRLPVADREEFNRMFQEH